MIFFVSIDDLDDRNDLDCVDLEIRRACERVVGLHSALTAKPALRRTSSSATMRAVRIGEDK